MNTEENIEYIPGTNIPKPRVRGIYETDEEYIKYLKEYYNMYFPEVENAKVETEKVSFEEVNEEIVKDDEEDFELELPGKETAEEKEFAFELEPEVKNENVEYDLNKQEKVDEEVINQVLMAEENKRSKDVQDLLDLKKEILEESNLEEIKENIQEEPIQEEILDEPVQEDGFKFDLEEEVVSFSNSNETLKSKVSNLLFISKVKDFFTNIKEKATQVIETIKEKQEFHFDLSENVAVEGRSL